MGLFNLYLHQFWERGKIISKATKHENKIIKFFEKCLENCKKFSNVENCKIIIYAKSGVLCIKIKYKMYKRRGKIENLDFAKIIVINLKTSEKPHLSKKNVVEISKNKIFVVKNPIFIFL